MGYTYVLSDVHGQLDCFESVLAQINLQPDDTLYVLGDVIDRGAHGIEILKRIMAMPNAKMLLGNHEFMMLNALGEPYDGKRRNVSDSCELWYGNGGGITHIGWFCLPNAQKAEMLDYLKSLPLNIDIEVGGKEYRLVHAADTEFYSHYKRQYRSQAEYSVWERNALAEMAESDKNYVFGHTGTFLIAPTTKPRILHNGNLIGIDCGCAIKDGFYEPQIGMIKGRLGCIRLDDMKEFYSGNISGTNRRKKKENIIPLKTC
ncbi:MAG: metallophosphoesterase family protein [Oscillospiraceae bacterium]